MNVSDFPDLPAPLEPVVEALEPALDRLLIIGGWAHLLHRFHPLARPSQDAPLMTSDCDLALPLQTVTTPWPPLDERLERAGFVLKQGGGELSESRVYVLEDDPGFSLQFLAVRRGDGRARDGSILRTIQVGGISAEVLGDLDLVAASPWTRAFRRRNGAIVGLVIAHPAPFVAGKILVSCAPQRGAMARAKDLVYVVDTLLLFQDRLDALREDAGGWRTRVGQKRRRRIEQAIRRQFVDPSDDLRRAVEQARSLPGERPASMSAFAGLCATGIPRLFGDLIRWPS